MSEPVNLDALREVMQDARGVEGKDIAKREDKVKLDKGKPGKRFGKGLKTNGFGTLSLDEQEQFQQSLRAHSIEFGLTGKGLDREVILPQSSLEGETAEVIRNLLASFGLAVG
jgi:hypothetical protein